MTSRIEMVRTNDIFVGQLKKIKEQEHSREYCGHDMQHLLDVARIGTILALQEGFDIPTDVIYAAALLHDIGRAQEYESGVPHDEASARLAREILPACGYDEDETMMVTIAIAEHRKHSDEKMSHIYLSVLGSIIGHADKLSRPCYSCAATKTCKWEISEKNSELTI